VILLKRDMLYEELIELDMEAADIDDFFEKMSVKLLKLGYVKETFLEAIKKREAEYPTALPVEPYAVAIPHTDSEHIIKPFIAPVRLKTVKWCEMAANDVEHDVRFVFILGIHGSNEHVELLQVLVENFQDAQLMKDLLEARTSKQYMKLLLIMKGLAG